MAMCIRQDGNIDGVSEVSFFEFAFRTDIDDRGFRIAEQIEGLGSRYSGMLDHKSGIGVFRMPVGEREQKIELGAELNKMQNLVGSHHVLSRVDVFMAHGLLL